MNKFNTGLFTNLLHEEWKDVQGYESFYQVSSQGNVRSLDRIELLSNGRLRKRKGMTLKQKINSSGYKVITLRRWDLEKSRTTTVHQLVARAFIDNPEGKPTVNHKNGDKTDNRCSNLEWATISEQTIHAYHELGIPRRGNAKYSPELKKQIYDYYKKMRCSIAELSRKFDVNQKTAGLIAKGQVSRKIIKLSDSDVQEIIRLRLEGMSLQKLARQFNCGTSQIHRITRGESRNVKYERDLIAE